MVLEKRGEGLKKYKLVVKNSDRDVEDSIGNIVTSSIDYSQ